VRVTMVGHDTVLIEMGGRRVVADPFFSVAGNPAYKRVEPPARTRDELLDVDAVLVSHTHFDHVDRPFLRALPEGTPVLLPRRAAWQRALIGARRIVPMQPWQEWALGELQVTAVPARHVAPTVGYVLEGEGLRVYFAGDTYYGAFLREVGERFALDAALIPVTTYRIAMTMGENEAVHAVRDLAPRVVIPIHLGLQPRLPLMRTRQSPDGFERKLRAAGLEAIVVSLRPGEAWTG